MQASAASCQASFGVTALLRKDQGAYLAEDDDDEGDQHVHGARDEEGPAPGLEVRRLSGNTPVQVL